MTADTITPYTPPPGLVPLLTPEDCLWCDGHGYYTHGDHQVPHGKCSGLGRVLPVTAVVVPVEWGFDVSRYKVKWDGSRITATQYGPDGKEQESHSMGCPLGRSGGVCEVQKVEYQDEQFTRTAIISKIRVGQVEVMQAGTLSADELKATANWNDLYPDHPWTPERWAWVCSDLRLEVTA